MKVECIAKFYDRDARTTRKEGEQFELTEQRLAQINGAGLGQLVKPLERPKRKPKASEE